MTYLCDLCGMFQELAGLRITESFDAGVDVLKGRQRWQFEALVEMR